MSLIVNTEPKENRQLLMTIQVDQERVDKELRKAARKVAGEYRIPGFRRGKVPYPVLLQYVGLPTLFNEFIEPLGEEVYKQALDESGIEPYAPASLDVSSLEPLTYELTIPLEPEIDLGDYRSLRVEDTDIEIDESELEAQLQSYRDEYAEWREVERPSQWGDTLVIDVKSVIIPEEGEEVAEGEETVVLDEQDWDVTLDEENPLEPPGFDQELIGLRQDEEKEFILEWPADSQSIYKGKKGRFQVKVHKVQAHEAPELNDEFAQLVGPDFQTLDDLKQNIRESLEQERKNQAENEFLEKALDKLVAQSTLVYPPAVVEDQINSMMSEFDRQLRQYGMNGLEAYLAQTGQSQEEYRESLREQAEIVARQNLVISELYRLEGIEVSEEDLEERIQQMLGEVLPDDDVEDTEEADKVMAEQGAADEVAATTATDEEADEEAGEATAEGNADETAIDETAADARPASRSEQTQAFRDLMLRGGGRQILESQILQQKALDRLQAIARGDELPPLPEKKPATEEVATTETGADEPDEASTGTEEDSPAAESRE